MIVPRSSVDQALREAGATFVELAGADVVADFGDPDGEVALARRLGLADLSPLPRAGFRGPGTREWLASQGVELPDGPNRARPQPDGSLAITRSWTEVLLLSDLTAASDTCARLAAGSDEAQAARAYPLPRYDGLLWFALTGQRAVQCLAKVCGVAMGEAAFPPGSVAQTSVARLSAVVARVNIGTTPLFHLLGDSASAEYLWESLFDAMDEFDGGPVGLKALHALSPEFE